MSEGFRGGKIPYTDLIRPYVEQAIKRERDALEQLCEVMLTTPDSPGISVQRVWSGLSVTTETRLNLDVPFGEIHYLPDLINDPV